MEYFKILVVHRQEVVLNEVEKTLSRFEPCLRRYECGFDGLQAAKVEHFDLIICGTDLPLITGFEMIRAIRNLSRNCFTPVLFLSDNVGHSHESLSRQLKAMAVLGSANLAVNLLFMLENTTAFSVRAESATNLM